MFWPTDLRVSKIPKVNQREDDPLEDIEKIIREERHFPLFKGFIESEGHKRHFIIYNDRRSIPRVRNGIINGGVYFSDMEIMDVSGEISGQELFLTTSSRRMGEDGFDSYQFKFPYSINFYACRFTDAWKGYEEIPKAIGRNYEVRKIDWLPLKMHEIGYLSSPKK